MIDHFCLDVYIYRNNSWEKWNRTSSLYLNNANDSVYEMRFNENKRYELKFGNDINGKKLQSTDLVAIYYLKSDGTEGEVGANVLNGKKLNIFNSLQFSSIIKNNALMTNYIDNSLVSNLLFNNSCGSTYYSEPESVDSIRQNAPANFRSQYSLTTAKSYETFIQSNFSSIIQDVKVKNNTEFLDTYIKYYYNLGLTQPQLESRALFNQLKFSDSCNFNNVYIFTVPKTVKNALGYVNSAQKELMISTMKEEKTLTAELIIMDPVYLALDIAISDGTSISFNNINTSNIYIQKNYNSRRNDSSIITEVNQIIQDYFARKNINLGQTIDLVYLQNLILGIDGVKKISTIDTLTNARVDGLKFIMWNPIIGDISLENLNGSKTLEDFQFPYLFSNSFINRIFVETGTSSVETIAA